MEMFCLPSSVLPSSWLPLTVRLFSGRTTGSLFCAMMDVFEVTGAVVAHSGITSFLFSVHNHSVAVLTIKRKEAAILLITRMLSFLGGRMMCLFTCCSASSMLIESWKAISSGSCSCFRNSLCSTGDSFFHSSASEEVEVFPVQISPANYSAI